MARYDEKTDENRRSHTILPRKPEPTHERDQIKLACIMPSEKEEDEVNRGMRTEQIAEMINRQRLHIRKDGQPVTANQVYAVICRYPDMFVKAEGRIMLMI